MPKLEQEGNYNVTIETALYEARPKPNDEEAFRIVLKGVTEDGFEAWGELEYSNYTFQSGKYKDQTCVQKSTDILTQLGVQDGYLPNLAGAIEAGLQANFALKWDSWTDKLGETKRTLKVAFINPIKKTVDIKEVDFADKIAKLTGSKPAQPDRKSVV